MALGRIAHDGVLTALGASQGPGHPFGHGAEHAIGSLRLFDSYHCSRYNTNTGVLTPEMFEAVFAQSAGLSSLDVTSAWQHVARTSAASCSGSGTGIAQHADDPVMRHEGQALQIVHAAGLEQRQAQADWRSPAPVRQQAEGERCCA